MTRLGEKQGVQDALFNHILVKQRCIACMLLDWTARLRPKSGAGRRCRPCSGRCCTC